MSTESNIRYFVYSTKMLAVATNHPLDKSVKIV